MKPLAAPHMGTLLGLVTILCPPPQWQLWALHCPPFTQTQISAAKSHLPSLPGTGIGVTRGNQMNSECESRGQGDQEKWEIFAGCALSASPEHRPCSMCTDCSQIFVAAPLGAEASICEEITKAGSDFNLERTHIKTRTCYHCSN